MNIPAYDPNRLLDALQQRLGVPSDKALSRKLKLGKGVLRELRCGGMPLGASLLLAMQEGSGMELAQLRALVGDRRARLRPALLQCPLARPATSTAP